MSRRAITIIEGRRRSGDPPALIANPQLGQSMLEWKPLKSDLQTMVRTAWEWHLSRLREPIRAETEEKLKSEIV